MAKIERNKPSLEEEVYNYEATPPTTVNTTKDMNGPTYVTCRVCGYVVVANEQVLLADYLAQGPAKVHPHCLEVYNRIHNSIVE